MATDMDNVRVGPLIQITSTPRADVSLLHSSSHHLANHARPCTTIRAGLCFPLQTNIVQYLLKYGIDFNKLLVCHGFMGILYSHIIFGTTVMRANDVYSAFVETYSPDPIDADS